MNKPFMIYNKKTEQAVKEYSAIRRFETMQGAKTAIAAIVRKSKGNVASKESIAQAKAEYEAMLFRHFDEHLDPMVETYNLMNPKGGPVMIRKSEKGGCCDPGTERYHCA